MKKVTSLVLMLCLAHSGALCYAHGEARTESKKGEDTPVLTIVKSQHGERIKVEVFYLQFMAMYFR